MWHVVLMGLLYVFNGFSGINFTDFLFSVVGFLILFYLYDFLRKKFARAEGYRYFNDFDLKYLIFSVLFSLGTLGFLKFLYFGSFHLESHTKDLKIQKHGEIVLRSLLPIVILGILGYFIDFSISKLVFTFVIFQLIPIPGLDGSFVFLSKFKKYNFYSIVLLLFSVVMVLFELSFIFPLLFFLAVVFLYYDVKKGELDA